jgi:hypothetical protein
VTVTNNGGERSATSRPLQVWSPRVRALTRLRPGGRRHLGEHHRHGLHRRRGGRIRLRKTSRELHGELGHLDHGRLPGGDGHGPRHGDNAGKRVWRSFATRSAAKRWREDAKVAVRGGDLSAERGPTLKEASDRWLAGVRDGTVTNRSGDPHKPHAARDYERIFRLRLPPTLGYLRLSDITARDAQKLVDDLVSKGTPPATVDATVTPLKALYRRAVARGDVRVNPTVGSKSRGCGAPLDASSRPSRRRR